MVQGLVKRERKSPWSPGPNGFSPVDAGGFSPVTGSKSVPVIREIQVVPRIVYSP